MNKVLGAVLKYLKQTDIAMIILSLAAAIFGIVMVYSATLWTKSTGISVSRTLIVQIAAVAIGFIAMIVISKFDYHTIGSWWYALAAISVLLFAATLVFGKQGLEGSQDKSWIDLKIISVQPAEFIKIAFIVTFSKHFDMVKDKVSSPLNVLLLGLHAAIPLGFLVLQKDMGMLLVFIFIFVCMIFNANIKLRYFAGGAIALLVGAPVIWNKIFGKTQRSRILALFDPTNSNYAKQMYQQNQGISAIGSGELWGYGLFNGPKTQSPSKSALPVRQTDMIFACIGEELGFIGCLAVIMLLVFIMLRILLDVRHAKDEMGAMICVGVFSMFAVQTIVNIGMCLRVLPVIGLTLPFFSSGGTSAVSSFLGIGLVLSVYMHRKDLLFAGQDSD